MSEKARVLIVEDSRTQAEVLRGLLEEEGYSVATASDGHNALDMLETEPFEVVITDIVMPEMNGYELCKRMKSGSKFHEIPVILLTSLSNPEDVIKGLECGADNFVSKPFDKRYLIKCLKSVLLSRELHQYGEAQMGLEVHFSGEKYFITSDRMQILNLLLSTYENAVRINQELSEAKKELLQLNSGLESKVLERTQQLSEEISNHRKTSQALLQSQKMEAIGKLAGGVAHDFNNMLMVIQGFTDILSREGSSPQLRQRSIQEIRKATDRAASLTQQLLAFSRKQVFQLEVFCQNVIIEETAKMIRQIIGEDIELVLSLADDLGQINADRGQFIQVIMNLAVNARDAMPYGGLLTIETSNTVLSEDDRLNYPYVQPGRYAMMKVRDTGTGLEKEAEEHLFEPFFTTKEKGKGTGLGLSTVYGIVKQSGGYVWCKSEPGKGCEFSVFFPLAMEQPKPLQIDEETGDHLRGNETVLLVEDEENVREILREILTHAGYTVFVAEDGQRGLDLVLSQKTKPDLILTDVVMPKMRGTEMAAGIRKQQPEMKFIFMSGYLDSKPGNEYSDIIERECFLQKPISSKKLLTSVRKVMDGKT